MLAEEAFAQPHVDAIRSRSMPSPANDGLVIVLGEALACGFVVLFKAMGFGHVAAF
jgi:hypothetical protein